MQDQCQRERITIARPYVARRGGRVPFWRPVTDVCQSLIPDNSAKRCTGALLVRVPAFSPDLPPICAGQPYQNVVVDEGYRAGFRFSVAMPSPHEPDLGDLSRLLEGLLPSS